MVESLIRGSQDLAIHVIPSPEVAAAQGRWSDYLLGSLNAMAEAEIRETGLSAALMTSLPMGAGLSSSAALEVASLRATAFRSVVTDLIDYSYATFHPAFPKWRVV